MKLLNLTGDKRNEDPSILTGESMDVSMEQEMQELNLLATLFGGKCHEILLACIFENWNHLDKNLLPFYRTYESTVEGYFTSPFNSFFYAMACYEMYGKTRNKKFKREARRANKKVRKWAEGGTVMISAPNRVLTAVDALCGMKETPDVIEELFQLAIDECEAYAYLGFEAMTTERIAKYFLMDNPNEEKARYYLFRSINLYRKWGAVAKVKWLQQRFLRSTI